MRTRDLVAVAPYVARMTPELLSVEAWGGATYDVALRFLGEDPWERLAALREALPNIAIQMLLRGRNTVGYTPYPTEVTEAFVQEAAATGVDIFRIFDALNDVEQMRPAIDAVLATGTTVAEVALCYTGDLLDPAEDLYTLDYYLRLAEQIVDAGAHILAIKDMAGLLRAGAAEKLVTALPRALRPPRARAHPRHRGRPARDPARGQPRRRGRGRRGERADGGHHEPAVGVRAGRGDRAHRARHRPLARTRSATSSRTGRRCAACTGRSSPGWPARPGASTSTRSRAASSPTSASRPSRSASATSSSRSRTCTRRRTGSSAASRRSRRRRRWWATSPCSSRPRTPTRRTSRGTREDYDIPDSVVGFMAGELGDLPGGWPEPFRTKVLQGRDVHIGVTPLSDEDRGALAGAEPRAAPHAQPPALPGADRAVRGVRELYGDLSVLDTDDYLYGLRPGVEHAVRDRQGRQVFIGLEAMGEADE